MCRAGAVGGQPVDGRTLLPVGPLALFLVADALAVAKQLDTAVCELGGKPVAVREVLAGPSSLPGYVDWLGKSRAIDTAELLRCAGVAARLGHVPIRDPAALALTMLLQPALITPRAPDLASALRARLAPYVAGLDPLDAAALGAERVVFGTADADLRRARPDAARLLLTVDEVARWWNWRVSQPWATVATPVSSSGEVDGYDGVEQWSTRVNGPGSPGAYVWRERRAALLLWTDAAHRPALIEQCQTCLFGPAGNLEQRLGGRLLAVPSAKPLAGLAGSSWLAVPAAGEPQFRLDIFDAYQLHVRRGGLELISLSSRPVAGGWVARLQPAAGEAEAELLLATVAGDPDRLEAVLIQRLAWQRVLPEHFVVVREPSGGK